MCCAVLCCAVLWCGAGRCSVVWCGVVWCGAVWCGVVQCMRRVQAQNMTIYTKAKIDPALAPNWPWNRSAGKLGTALHNILKMLCNTMPNSPGDRF